MRTAHVIHTTGIGGVESAVARLARRLSPDRYTVLALAPGQPEILRAQTTGASVNSPRSFITALRVLRHYRPEVLVTSLWRSVLIGGLYRACTRRCTWIVYVHNCGFTHIIDRLVHMVGCRWADRIFCDSLAARDAVVPKQRHARTRIVRPSSELLTLPVTAPAVHAAPEEVRLLYWGRFAPQKRLDRAVDLLNHLHRQASHRFVLEIIAPASAEFDAFLHQARATGVTVRWHGPQSAVGIARIARDATFFIQLSDYEGLAMSVTEALHLGLIPIVTPVGEIPRYACDGTNAIYVGAVNGTVATVGDDVLMLTADRIMALLADPAGLHAMQRSARTVDTGDFVAEFEQAVAEAHPVRDIA